MATIVGSALDVEIRKMKGLLEVLKRDQTTFSNTFQNMRPKDRANMIRKVQGDQRALSDFLEKLKRQEISNSGTRFSIENLRQSFQALLTLWRKTEKNLENFMQGSAPKTMPEGKNSQTQGAVESYVKTLNQIGQTASPEMIKDFKAKLETAYTQAKNQAGGKNIEIKIIQDGTKIKVRMEPKG